MKTQPLILGLLTILSCSTKQDIQTDTESDSITSDIQLGIGQTRIVATDSVLYKSEVLHHFSSTTDKDTFRIVVTGQSINDGQFRFQIITKDSQVILDETYATTMLLDYGLKDNPTNSETEEHVIDRIDKFFNVDNFHQPAISKGDEYEEDYSERETWDDISSDESSVGFYYLIGEEDGRHIAYSKKHKKVVLYFSCC